MPSPGHKLRDLFRSKNRDSASASPPSTPPQTTQKRTPSTRITKPPPSTDAYGQRSRATSLAGRSPRPESTPPPVSSNPNRNSMPPGRSPEIDSATSRPRKSSSRERISAAFRRLSLGKDDGSHTLNNNEIPPRKHRSSQELSAQSQNRRSIHDNIPPVPSLNQSQTGLLNGSASRQRYGDDGYREPANNVVENEQPYGDSYNNARNEQYNGVGNNVNNHQAYGVGNNAGNQQVYGAGNEPLADADDSLPSRQRSNSSGLGIATRKPVGSNAAAMRSLERGNPQTLASSDPQDSDYEDAVPYQPPTNLHTSSRLQEGQYLVKDAKEAPSLQGVVDLSNTVDTTVHERWAPAVTHETVHREIHHIREEQITRDIHLKDVHHRILPVIDVQVLPARHFVPTDTGHLVEVSEDDLPGRTGHKQDWLVLETVSKLGAPSSIPTGPRQFSARQFASRDAEERVYMTKQGFPRTEKTWIHPPTLEDGSELTGQTVPFYFGCDDPADDGLRIDLPTRKIDEPSRYSVRRELGGPLQQLHRSDLFEHEDAETAGRLGAGTGDGAGAHRGTDVGNGTGISSGVGTSVGAGSAADANGAVIPPPVPEHKDFRSVVDRTV